MEYSEWLTSLFEDTYPVRLLSHGKLSWANEETLYLVWGHRKILLTIQDFYNPESDSPVCDVVGWVYRNMPLQNDEYEKAYVSWNPASACFDSYLNRPEGILFSSKRVNPGVFPTYSNSTVISSITKTSLEGTILTIECTEKGIPASVAVSNKEVFSKLISEHIDYNDELEIILPYFSQRNIVLAGHSTSMQRLAHESPGRKCFTASEWFNGIADCIDSFK